MYWLLTVSGAPPQAPAKFDGDQKCLPRRGLSVLTATVRGVKQVVKVRMLPTEVQEAALEATVSTCNEAASWLSAAMHSARVRHKHEVQKQFYIELKERFGLSAQPAIRVIGKVADAYATLRAKHRRWQLRPTRVTAPNQGAQAPPRSSFAPMRRNLSMRGACPGRSPTSLAGVTRRCRSGRPAAGFKRMQMLAAPRDLVLLRTRPIGETDLIRRDGKWFLYATIEAPESRGAAAGQRVPRCRSRHCEHRHQQRPATARPGRRLNPLPKTTSALA